MEGLNEYKTTTGDKNPNFEEKRPKKKKQNKTKQNKKKTGRIKSV